jgi:hypothetical protein
MAELPVNEAQRMNSEWLLLQELTRLEVDYWYEVDHNWGRSAHTFYVTDGAFTIGDKAMKGAEAIEGFYKWREGRGDRAARHLVTNFRLASQQGMRVAFDCILSLYAADGRPPLPSEPPIMIADIHSQCERDQDGRWRFRSHVLVPIFTGSTPATLPPT